MGPGSRAGRAGIVGFGNVGRLIARRLRAFDMRVVAFDPGIVKAAGLAGTGVEPVAFDELLQFADNHILLAAPLLASTRHLFDAAALARMKPGAFLVNVGRGSVVDEAAVADALRSGRLAGYAADVFEIEDLSLPERPAAIAPGLLEDTARTVLTPHLDSAVDEVRRTIERAAALNIVDVLEGHPPRNAVNRPQAPADHRQP